MPKPYVILAALSLFITAGCESFERFSDDRPQLVAAPDRVSAMLADAADRASTALETLAAVEQKRTPAANVNPVSGAPAELTRAITLDWVGPVEPVAKTLADRASYKFNVIGSGPPVPIVVSIQAENTPVIDILRSLGLQLGEKANIKVDASQQLIELSYPGNEAGGV